MDNATKTKIKYEISEIDILLEKSSVLVSLCKSREPGFLQVDLRLQMTEYMGFRHFYRHTYGYTIKWEKCSHLFFNMIDFWTKIKSALVNYCELV